MATGVCWGYEIVYAPCRQRAWACRSACACIMALTTGGGVRGVGDGTVSWWWWWWKEVASVVIVICTKCVMHVLKDVRIRWVMHERREYGTWKMYVFLGFGMKDVLLIIENILFCYQRQILRWSYVFHAQLKKYVRLSISSFTSFKQNPQ